MNKSLKLKITISQAIQLSFISVVFGLSFVFLITYYPDLANNDFLTHIMIIIIISPLTMAIYVGIPITISYKKEICKLSLTILLVIVGLISSIFFYYYLYEKPILFDSAKIKFTVSFLFIFPFLFFSFYFIVLTNTLLRYFLKYKFNFVCSMLVMVYSRGLFLIACVYLLFTILTYIRFHLINLRDGI
jgi:hypothetical protein